MAEERMTISDAFNLAQKNYHAGDFGNASTLCCLILDVLPEDEAALSLLSVVAIGQQDWNRAEQVLRVAIKHYPASYIHHLNLAVVLKQTNRNLAAVESYETVLRLNPLHQHAYRVLASIYRQQGALEQSISTLRKCLEAMPDDVTVMEDLADNILSMQTDYLRRQSEHGKERLIEAGDLYRRVCERGGAEAKAHVNYGSVLVQLGMLVEAAEQCNYAIQAGENSGSAHYVLAYALVGMGDLEGSYQAQKIAFARHVKETTLIR